MDIKQDPNSIPNFGDGGRIGELSANEPEQVESSVELDQDEGTNAPAGAGQEALPGDARHAGATPQPAAQTPTLAGGAGLPVDPSKTGDRRTRRRALMRSPRGERQRASGSSSVATRPPPSRPASVRPPRSRSASARVM
jgi:hypothetical protein